MQKLVCKARPEKLFQALLLTVFKIIFLIVFCKTILFVICIAQFYRWLKFGEIRKNDLQEKESSNCFRRLGHCITVLHHLKNRQTISIKNTFVKRS